MNPIMYILVNRSLGMSIGKTAAQVGHAVINAYQISDPALRYYWDTHSYPKIILGAKDSEEMWDFVAEAKLKCFNVIDEGRTEIKKDSYTATGFEIVDKEKHGGLFKRFKLL